MRLLESFTLEYLSLVNLLMQDHPVENDRIILDREYFKYILEKYPYMSFKEKTKIYKDLNLIIHDKSNYTMPYKDPNLKKTVRKVIINYRAYESLKNLYEIMT